MTATSTAEPSSTPTAAPLFSVSGHIYHADSAVSVDDVIVRLRDLDAEHVATAGSSGYQLGAIPPGPCEIEPAKIDFIRNAISAYDAAYILQSLGGERALDPFQQQACDVTGDGQLDESDVSTILQMTVGIDRRFPAGVACGSDWLFAPRGTSEATREMLPPRLDGTCQPGRIVFSSLTTSAAGQDFDARLIGDCTGNWPTTIVAGGGALSNGEPMNARASTGRVRRARGQSVQVPLFVRTDRPYYSLEAEIAYDPTEVQPTGVQLRPSSKGATVSYHLVSPGKLRVALASAKAIEHQAAAVLRVAFTRARGTVTNDPVRLMALKVDEQVIDMNAPLLRARTQSQRHR